MKKYMFIHSEAELTSAQRKIFADWAEKESVRMERDSAAFLKSK
jgi:hypothetical protein